MKERIKQVREQNGLSLTRFADVLGLTVSAVSLYESGKREPSNAVLTSISKTFGVSFAWLKTGDGPMEDPMMDEAVSGKIIDSYRNLPDRLRMLVDALVEMDPEWWKTLDAAFAEIERRKGGGD